MKKILAAGLLILALFCSLAECRRGYGGRGMARGAAGRRAGNVGAAAGRGIATLINDVLYGDEDK